MLRLQSRIALPLKRQNHVAPRNRNFGSPIGIGGTVTGDSIIATAILDRLLHHSTTINIRGESNRLTAARPA
jgi:hypothetical protein